MSRSALRVKRFFRRKPYLVCWSGALTSLLLLGTFYRPVVVQGRSMAPTFRDGQLLWMDRQHYRFHTFRPGDIVIFRYDDEVYIKRVYATGGSQIRLARMSNGYTWLVDQLPTPGSIVSLLRAHPESGYLTHERVPVGYLYVIGDNENNSVDSRDFGPVPSDSVLGYIRPPRGKRMAPWQNLAKHRHVAQR